VFCPRFHAEKREGRWSSFFSTVGRRTVRLEIFAGQVAPSIKKVASSKDPALSATLVANQLVGIAFLRYVLKLPAVVNLQKEELITNVGETLQRYLDGS